MHIPQTDICLRKRKRVKQRKKGEKKRKEKICLPDAGTGLPKRE
jgi:hypothetical protein